MKRPLLTILAVLLLAAFVGVQVVLKKRNAADVPAAGIMAAVGGLRSLAAEVIWFRADRLQEEGRYVEMAQLAHALTAMEPHTPEVWSYAAWNLAYNVSVMMATAEDRWRWVKAAIELLRDGGLVQNPHSAELYCELAWLFELKLGAKVDSASATYRRLWAEIVRDVKSRGAWEELKMDPSVMARIEQASGCTNWENPQLSAIYWAARALPDANERERKILLEIIRQARLIYARIESANEINK